MVGEAFSHAVAGSPVTVNCHAEGGHPHPVITLYKDQAPLLTHTFVPSIEDHLARIECEALNKAMGSPLHATHVLSVHRK